jgi:hypothetical protein
MTDEINIILSDIKNRSTSLLQKMLIIMREIDENGENSDMVQEIEYICNIDKKVVIKYLEDKTVNMVEDTEKISREIDIFSKIIMTDPEKLDEHINDCPFLASVWFGDSYDKDGPEALKMLIKDLKEQIKNANEDYIIDSSKDHFAKNKIAV